MLSERGSLKDTQPIQLLLTIFDQGLTGVLSIKRESIQKVLYFKKGSLIWAISNLKNDDLESIIVSRSLVAPKNIERVKQMIDSPEDLGKALVEKGLLSLEELIETSREQLKIIAGGVLTWEDGDFRFEKEDPPARLLSLELDVTDFIRNFILMTLDIGYIRQQIGPMQAEFVKNPDNKKTKKYNLSDKQLQLLDCFDGATSIEKVLARYPTANRESVLKIIYYFLTAEILLDERLEFLDSPALRASEDVALPEVEKNGHKPGEAERPGEQEDTYGIAREIEIEKPAMSKDIDEPLSEANLQEAIEAENVLGINLEPEEDIKIGMGKHQPDVYEADHAIEKKEAGEDFEAFASDYDEKINTSQNQTTEPEGGDVYEVEGNEVLESIPTSGEQSENQKPLFPGFIEKTIPEKVVLGTTDESFLPDRTWQEKYNEDTAAPGSFDRKFVDDMEPIKVEEDFIRNREPATFRKVVVVDKKKSKLLYLVLLSIAVILIISGAIFLYLKYSKNNIGEDIIPPVKVEERKTKFEKGEKRTEIVMKKEDQKTEDISKPTDMPPQESKDRITKKSAEIAAKPREKIYERFDITNDELKKKLMEKEIRDIFNIKLGEPAALKYFKEGNFFEAGNTWKKELNRTGIKFTILLEMDCLKESVINAYLKIDSKESFYILNRKLGERNCFLVMWGKFYTKQEAGDALKLIPEYFRQQQHPPEVISLSRYLNKP